MTELATLERKRLSDLHQIASQLGIEQYRKYRKPELAEMIYKVATEQAGAQNTVPASDSAPPVATPTPEATEPAEPALIVAPPNGDGTGEAEASVAVPDEIGQRRQEQQRNREKEPRQRQDRRPDRNREERGREERGREDRQLEASLGVVLERLPRLRLVDTDPPSGAILRRTEHLEVRWD